MHLTLFTTRQRPFYIVMTTMNNSNMCQMSDQSIEVAARSMCASLSDCIMHVAIFMHGSNMSIAMCVVTVYIYYEANVYRMCVAK